MRDATKTHCSDEVIFFHQSTVAKIGQTTNFIKFDHMICSARYSYVDIYLTISQPMYLVGKRK